MLFTKKAGGSLNRLTSNFKKIPFLIFLIVLTALTAVYCANTIYGFIDLLFFDVAAEDAMVSLMDAIVSVVGALIILPLAVCGLVSTYSGWKLFVLPHAAAGNIASLGMFSKSVKIYETYVYVLTAIGTGIIATVFTLFAFVLTGAEEFAESVAEYAELFGLVEDPSTITALFENQASTLAISYIIAFAGTILFCVMITRAFGALSKHFVALSNVATDAEAVQLPKTPLVTIILGVIFLGIAAATEFMDASVFAGVIDILLIALLISAAIFFKTVKLEAVECNNEESVAEETVEAAESNETTDEDAVEETGEVTEPVAEEVTEEAETEATTTESEADVVEAETVEPEPTALETEAETEVTTTESEVEVVEAETVETEAVTVEAEEAPVAEETESVNA